MQLLETIGETLILCCQQNSALMDYRDDKANENDSEVNSGNFCAFLR